MSDTSSLNSLIKKVFLCHVVLLCLLFFITSAPPLKPKRHVVHVSTVALSPVTAVTPSSEATPVTTPQPKKEEKKEEKKKEAPAPKKETPKKKESPKAENKPAPPKAEPKKTDGKKEALLKEAKESLAKMRKSEATSPERSRTSLTPLASLKAEDGRFAVKGLNDFYTGELVKRLKLSLRLPENGEVLVDLTLQRSGQVVAVKIRETNSPINRKYVESTLPNLTFPEFGEYYPKDEQKIFTLSLQNELF